MCELFFCLPSDVAFENGTAFLSFYLSSNPIFSLCCFLFLLYALFSANNSFPSNSVYFIFNFYPQLRNLFEIFTKLYKQECTINVMITIIIGASMNNTSNWRTSYLTWFVRWRGLSLIFIYLGGYSYLICIEYSCFIFIIL